MSEPPGRASVLERVCAALARRALRRAGVRVLLDLEVGPVRHDGGEVYVPAAGGGWRAVATTTSGQTAPLWRPSPFWQRPREAAPSRWAREVPPSDPTQSLRLPPG